MIFHKLSSLNPEILLIYVILYTIIYYILCLIYLLLHTLFLELPQLHSP